MDWGRAGKDSTERAARSVRAIFNHTVIVYHYSCIFRSGTKFYDPLSIHHPSSNPSSYLIQLQDIPSLRLAFFQLYLHGVDLCDSNVSIWSCDPPAPCPSYPTPPRLSLSPWPRGEGFWTCLSQAAHLQSRKLHQWLRQLCLTNIPLAAYAIQSICT